MDKGKILVRMRAAAARHLNNGMQKATFAASDVKKGDLCLFRQRGLSHHLFFSPATPSAFGQQLNVTSSSHLNHCGI